MAPQAHSSTKETAATGFSSPGRALAAIETPVNSSRHASLRHSAPFIVHLIATATQMPQTRVLRRASNDDVKATYDDAVARNSATTVSSTILLRVA